MASTRCLATLLGAGDFKALDVDAQEARLVQFLSEEWFGPEPIDVIDNIRFSQRIRVHAAVSGASVGDLMIGLLQEAQTAYRAARMQPDIVAGQAVHREDQPASGRLIGAVPAEAVPAEAVPAEAVPMEAVPMEAVPMEALGLPPESVSPAPAPGAPKSRSKRVKTPAV